MTERKNKFTKVNTKVISDDQLSPGGRGLEIDIQETGFDLPGFRDEENRIWKIKKVNLVFYTNHELYDVVLNNQSLELTIEDSEIMCHPKGINVNGPFTAADVWEESKTATIIFKSESAHKLKLIANQETPPNPKNFTDLENEVNTALKSEKIEEIEKMKSEVQIFLATSNENKDEAQALLAKLEQKEQELKKTDSPNSSFPWKIVVPVALSLIVVLGLVIHFIQKKKRK